LDADTGGEMMLEEIGDWLYVNTGNILVILIILLTLILIGSIGLFVFNFFK
jgi:hypothetical protein